MCPPWECGPRCPPFRSHTASSPRAKQEHQDTWGLGSGAEPRSSKSQSWDIGCHLVFGGDRIHRATACSRHLPVCCQRHGGTCVLWDRHVILRVPTSPGVATSAPLACMSDLFPVPPAAPPAGSSCPPLPACSFWHTALSKTPVEQGGTQGHQAAGSRPSTGSHADALCVTFCIGTCLKQGVALGDHVCQTGCAPACLDHGQVSLLWPGRPSHLFPGRRPLHTPDSLGHPGSLTSTSLLPSGPSTSRHTCGTPTRLNSSGEFHLFQGEFPSPCGGDGV